MNEFNVIDRLCSGIKKATTAVVLTHNIDFLFVESILLPKLREIGSPQLTIFADAACAANSYRSQVGLLSKLGSRYRVVPVELGPARRFHPKALFLCGEDNAVLAVGSGNITHGGWSANQEIWSDFAHPGDGGGQIAAFRDYLERILALVPDAQRLRSHTSGAYAEPKNLWIGSLPPTFGLAFTPSEVTMLDQILAFTGENIESIDMLSPYFDDEGAALKSLASIAPQGLNVLMQPGRAGLAAGAAKTLPASVRLKTIEALSEKSRKKFLHAKAYVLRSATRTVIASGSANCSRAALLATHEWGNAELLALTMADDQEVSDLFDGFTINDAPPDLPMTPLSDDWELESPDLRIMTARREGTHLEVRFKSARPLARLFMMPPTPEAPLIECKAFKDGSADFIIEGTARSLSLQGIAADGETVVSAPSWIDDERSLRMAAPERMLKDKLDDAAARGSLTGAEYLRILELFDLHTQRKPAGGGRAGASDDEQDPDPIPFTEDDIYSEGFGRPPSLFNPTVPIGYGERDALALFAAFFETRQAPTPRPSPLPGDGGGKDGDDLDEDAKPQEVKDAEDKEDRAKLGLRVVRLLKKIVESIAKPAFVESRTAPELARDLGFLSMLMTMARSDGNLPAATYREQTLSLWRALFFGADGKSGLIPMRISALEVEEQTRFIREMHSPRLSAAMTLWCMLDWHNADQEAKQFRFAAASLAAKYRWLSEGGTQEQILTELQNIADTLLPSQDRSALFGLWVNWVRDGHAFETIANALGKYTQLELAALCTRESLSAGALTWQIGRGYCTLSMADKKSAEKFTLLPIDQSAKMLVQTKYLAPLQEILKVNIGVSDNVKGQLFSLMHAIGYDLHPAA
ncbi:hypothetical protein ABAC460_17180 [Asticcacaulis sp. AC460]|uniref:hypothetical protein n=1 Tax=Asticcacaulis sp. AC460 TaxID=1282360 RepID=UPI0003C3DF94|nr:hypothetical protein [Asticcacaulis sp. AC460]ESQ87924.1 hypothetical protein ABAC460_17180 [Asticcacaulis sp. AC460]